MSTSGTLVQPRLQARVCSAAWASILLTSGPLLPTILACASFGQRQIRCCSVPSSMSMLAQCCEACCVPSSSWPTPSPEVLSLDMHEGGTPAEVLSLDMPGVSSAPLGHGPPVEVLSLDMPGGASPVEVLSLDIPGVVPLVLLTPS